MNHFRLSNPLGFGHGQIALQRLEILNLAIRIPDVRLQRQVKWLQLSLDTGWLQTKNPRRSLHDSVNHFIRVGNI